MSGPSATAVHGTRRGMTPLSSTGMAGSGASARARMGRTRTTLWTPSRRTPQVVCGPWDTVMTSKTERGMPSWSAARARRPIRDCPGGDSSAGLYHGRMADTTTAPIAVTEPAAQKAIALSQREGFAQAILRLRVLAGGCSGFSYKLSFENDQLPDDHVIEAFGLRVLVDPKSVPIGMGSNLEFNDAMLGGGVKLNHSP